MTKYTSVCDEVDIEVDIFEVMEKLTDDELREYLRARDNFPYFGDMEEISVAIKLLQDNLYKIDELDKLKLKEIIEELNKSEMGAKIC